MDGRLDEPDQIVAAGAGEMAGQVKVVKLNIDENPNVAMKFGVRSIPTLILFNKGQPAAMQVGAAPKGKLVEWIKGAVA